MLARIWLVLACAYVSGGVAQNTYAQSSVEAWASGNDVSLEASKTNRRNPHSETHIPNSQKLTCTGEHRFWVTNRDADGNGILGEWIEAEHLLPGDRFLLTDSGEAGLKRIEALVDPDAPSWSQAWPSTPDEVLTTYNFAVADFHTYYVGQDGVWVHNVGDECRQRRLILRKFPGEGDGHAAVRGWLRRKGFTLQLRTRVNVRHHPGWQTGKGQSLSHHLEEWTHPHWGSVVIPDYEVYYAAVMNNVRQQLKGLNSQSARTPALAGLDPGPRSVHEELGKLPQHRHTVRTLEEWLTRRGFEPRPYDGTPHRIEELRRASLGERLWDHPKLDKPIAAPVDDSRLFGLPLTPDLWRRVNRTWSPWPRVSVTACR